MELGNHLDQTLNTLSESLREQRRAAFLLNLAEDNGYLVAQSDQLSLPQLTAEIV